MGTNLLLNPTLTGFSVPPRTFVDKTGNTGYMENPDHWEYVWTAMDEADPNQVPQSLHRDRGYCIAAGWRVWEAGYVQRGVALRGGQRYLAKAEFQPQVNFPNGPVDLTSVQWRFWIESADGEAIFSNWETTKKGQYKQDEEHLLVVEARRDISVDFYFKARSIWASNVCDFNIYRLSLEEVPADYGTPVYIGGADSTPAPMQRTGFAPVEDAGPTDAAGDQPRTITLTLSDDDIDVIVMGLRMMKEVTPNASVIAGFNRLADVLERMKQNPDVVG